MPDLSASEYQLARLLIERGLGAIYVVAFAVALRQFPPLSGETGLQPAPRILRATRFWQTPSVFHLGYSDRLLRAVAVAGAALGLLIVVGLPQRAPLLITMTTWFALWALYQSIVNIGGTFYGFGWESLLLEAGFLAIFLGNGAVAPPWPVILAYRWLGFRLEFGAGMIKLRGDPCWRQLTCMDWHHETQPMPNPLSWFFHHLPRRLHRVEVLGNFAAQLVLPFGLFLPQPVASSAAALMIATQLYLVASGNYAWLNWLTIVILCSGVTDRMIGAHDMGRAPLDGLPLGFTLAVLALAALVVVLSWRPAHNLLSSRQVMNAAFDPLHLVNTYGAFGSVGRRRLEVIIEGTAEETIGPDTQWREYELPGKPGDVRRMPRPFAPYHLRLDWVMWFLPLSPRYGRGWFHPLLTRLLEGDAAILRLFAHNPFPHHPPTYVRALVYEYRFTTWSELRRTGAWWSRRFEGVFVDPLRLPSRRAPAPSPR